jgi:hypothetical protein
MPHRFPFVPPSLALAAVLALGVGAAAAAPTSQAPASWRLTHIGRDTMPIVVRGSDGQALVSILRETVTFGPGDRAQRVTSLRAAVYDRMPCDLLRELRAKARGASSGTPGVSGGGTSRAAADTTAAECEAMRVETDTITGTVSGTGAARVVTWSAKEPRLRLEERGDTLVLRPEDAAGGVASEAGGALRYVRARR